MKKNRIALIAFCAASTSAFALQGHPNVSPQAGLADDPGANPPQMRLADDPGANPPQMRLADDPGANPPQMRLADDPGANPPQLTSAHARSVRGAQVA